MLNICFEYDEEFNLKFSADPNPTLSKTKCLYICGHMEPNYPLPLKLGDHELPWVVHASHLGHELYHMCNMEFDAQIKWDQFIENSVQIQKILVLLNPERLCKQYMCMLVTGMEPCCWTCLGIKQGKFTTVGTFVQNSFGKFLELPTPTSCTTS